MSIMKRGAGLWFRKAVKARTKVVGRTKPRTLLQINDLQRRIEALDRLEAETRNGH